VAVVAVVGSAAGGLEQIADALVRPLLELGHQVPVTVTPAAAQWLSPEDTDALDRLTGFPVRSAPRLPSGSRPHPDPDLLVAAPATANTVAKLALGIGDNQALTVLCENLTVRPTVVLPRVNAAHARHPAWAGHLAALRSAGARLVYGEDVWPLYEPRQAPPGRPLPWDAVVREVTAALRDG
jgi:phosphopantothenoylcysteine synthetase/decarboxylase